MDVVVVRLALAHEVGCGGEGDRACACNATNHGGVRLVVLCLHMSEKRVRCKLLGQNQSVDGALEGQEATKVGEHTTVVACPILAVLRGDGQGCLTNLRFFAHFSGEGDFAVVVRTIGMLILSLDLSA